MRTHGDEPRGSNRRNVPLSPLFEGRFGRMFRRLSPAPALSDADLEALAEQMREPGPTGGWDGVTQDLDNSAIPAGYTYFGQFVDHDVTFDPVSSLDRTNDPDALSDFRTPRFDLDSLYGSGPADEPFQYDVGEQRRLLVGANQAGDPDLPRNAQGLALIGDPRNDENIIVSQLQRTFLQVHNKLLDEVLADPSIPDDQKFVEAQRLTRWHYQWVIVHDYLPRICGDDLVEQLFSIDETSGEADFNLRYYRAEKRAYMPIEFSVAAFRFGHSMVRGIYNLSGVVRDRPIFAPGDEVGELDDLRGRRPLPAQWLIDWTQFFVVDGSTPQPSRQIDSRLVPALFDLPGAGRSLAFRNLKRGQALELPSGQDVARFLRVPKIYSGPELDAPEPTPLWFYILKESELDPDAHGLRLGPVGARIVAEVLLGLLKLDKHAWMNLQTDWTPTIPGGSGDRPFTLGDIVRFASA